MGFRSGHFGCVSGLDRMFILHYQGHERDTAPILVAPTLWKAIGKRHTNFYQCLRVRHGHDFSQRHHDVDSCLLFAANAGFCVSIRGSRVQFVCRKRRVALYCDRNWYFAPFCDIVGDFVMSANFKYKDYSLLFPVMEFGTEPIWKGVFYAAGGLLELLGILFFQEHLSKRPRFGNLMLIIVLLAGLILGPLMGSIAIFGPNEAAVQRYPAYEQWRMVQLGQYIAHLDFFSIYQWLTGTFIRVTLVLFIMVDIWKPSKKLPWLMLAGALMIVAVILPVSDARFLDFLREVYFPVSVYFALGLTALFVSKIWISNRIRK